MASPLNRHFCAQIEWNLQYKDDVRIREFRSPLTCRTWLYSPLSQVRLPQQKRRWQLRHVYKYTRRRWVKVPREDARRTRMHLQVHTAARSHEPAIDLHLRESRASCITLADLYVSLGFLINSAVYIFVFMFAGIRCKFTPDNGVCSNRRSFISN
jgi:hypothetical protein